MFSPALLATTFQPTFFTPPPTPWQLYNIDDELPPQQPPPAETDPHFEAEPDLDVSDPEASYFDPTSSSPSSQPQSSSSDPWAPMPFYPFISQASTPHNRRMIIPYEPKKGSTTSSPLVLFRFFEFYCAQCQQTWLSPLFRAKNGCYCRSCKKTFVLPRNIRHGFTPYLGKETCYGKYSCHFCNRGWSSYRSKSNVPTECFQCGTLVYPYYQIPYSVLYQKIHKNSCYNTTSPFLQSFMNDVGILSELQDSLGTGTHENLQDSIPLPLSARGTVLQDQQSRSHHNQPRKITSISGIRSLTKQTSTNIKKRLHCLNNVPFLHQQHSSQLRRQIHLKPCFSEPTIASSNGSGSGI